MIELGLADRPKIVSLKNVAGCGLVCLILKFLCGKNEKFVKEICAAINAEPCTILFITGSLLHLCRWDNGRNDNLNDRMGQATVKAAKNEASYILLDRLQLVRITREVLFPHVLQNKKETPNTAHFDNRCCASTRAFGLYITL